MARVNVEEWRANLQAGHVVSTTLPGGETPVVGTVISIDGPEDALCGFRGLGLRRLRRDVLQPVATGSGGSVGLPVRVSDVMGRMAERAARS